MQKAMTSEIRSKVIFYQVKDNGAKIKLIYTKAQEAYKLEKRLLIIVPNFEAAQYVETLLWREPIDSFMPHVVADTSTSEWIAITMQDQHNVNQATSLLNLCPTPPSIYSQFNEVYELYDETHPQKSALSQERLQYYKSQGVAVTY